MITEIKAIEVGRFDSELTAAIQAAHKILGWGSTGALAWLTSPDEVAGLYGHHVLVATGEFDREGREIYESPRLGDTDFRFVIDEEVIEGWSHGARIVLRADFAMAESCGGHWVTIRLLADGDIDVNVDDKPSRFSWGDLPKDDEPWLSSTEICSMRIERIYRAME